MMTSLLTPGMLVRHPDEQGWGLGQVQSNIDGKITVIFENKGNIVIDAHEIGLVPVFDR